MRKMWGKPKSVNQFTTVLLVFILCLGIVIFPFKFVTAEEATVDSTGEKPSIADITSYVREITYPEYLKSYPDAIRPDAEIIIPANTFVNATTDIELIENYQGLPGIFVKTGERGYIEWNIQVEEAGFYNLEITYHPIVGRSSSIQRGIEINGKKPFSEAGFFTLHRAFGDEGPYKIDIYGNHLRPRQVEIPMWHTVSLSDPLGYEQEPFLFYLNQGSNQIRLVAVNEPLLLHSLRFYQKPEPKDYQTVWQEYQAAGYQPAENVFIKIQGEDSIYRSSPTLFPEHDMGDPTVEPYHQAQIRLNSIGGHRWKNIGDWAAWEFEVPVSGLYKIGIKGKQDQLRGVYSSRRLLIDGEVPFKEASALRFPYNQNYLMVTPTVADSDETALVYLEAGKHELRLEAVLGDVANILRKTEDTMYNLNTIYRRIIMITSGQPDPLRSYELEKKIPGLLELLAAEADALREIAAEFEEFTGQRGSHISTLNTFVLMLEDMVKRPHKIPTLIPDFRDNVGALGRWIQQTMEQPLQIDYIVIASPEQEFPRTQPTFLETLRHEILAFLASFTYDYKRVGDMGSVTADKDILKVWIGSGRDQAQVIKQMIEDDFTPQTGIAVDLELIEGMDSLLIPSIIAGTAPDVALGAANMDLAFRGALVDLTQFDDFEEVATRFMKSAFLPYRFRDKVYALPESQGFPMLFYRKDVLQDLGLEVPQTWDEVYAIIPELQKENLEFGLHPNMNTYQMMLYQKGVPLFKEDVVSTNLDSEIAIQTFNDLTNLYTLFNLLQAFDEANRFRMGEMPLLIANYGLYNTLSVFAPELRGEWGFTMVPGIRMPDGTINRAVSVAGTVAAPGSVAVPSGTSGAIILEGSKQKDKAWEFLKWWTSTPTQVRFGREMESLMGAAARYATANVEAMMQLPWRAEEREVLLEQWKWVEGVPAVLGAYYVHRQFDWLFRAVVIDNEPVRESILEYDRAINEEITRKREEFGLETSRDQLSQELIDLYWEHYTHLYRLDH
ncbi:MAG: extracellular solute-binding protein [Firmicutes bacterium]|nr:extracellular solute-binding protein [Bacillota bacterium]